MFSRKNLLFLLPLLFSLELSAKEMDLQSIDIAQGRAITNELKHIFPDTIGGDVVFKNNYFVSVGYTSYVFENLIRDGESSLQFGWEVKGAQHYGPNEILEMDLNFFIKYARIFPPSSFINMDMGWGEGASYVFGSPTIDDDPFGKTNEKYPLISYFMIDLDFYLKQRDDIHFFTRIHHRSGMYGLIAPPNVGSNFLAYGFRFYF